MSSTGTNAETGAVLRDWDDVAQSIRTILGTRIGSRVMRRQFGFAGLGLLGRRLTIRQVSLWRLAVVVALARWEPRVRVRGFAVTGTTTEIRAGQIGMTIVLDYLPRGHLGDTTVAATRELSA